VLAMLNQVNYNNKQQPIVIASQQQAIVIAIQQQ
jgi:hypothetical protein